MKMGVMLKYTASMAKGKSSAKGKGKMVKKAAQRSASGGLLKGKKVAAKSSGKKSFTPKKTTTVRDIKPQKMSNFHKKVTVKSAMGETNMDDTFHIRHVEHGGAMKSHMPQVEPLDEDNFEEEFDENDELDVDIDYAPARMPAMKVAPVQDNLLEGVQKLAEDVKQVATMAPPMQEASPQTAKDYIKVRFSSFVQLVSQYDITEVLEVNAEEDIIMSSNLLTELASSRDKKQENRSPMIFLVGIAIGVVLTYIFFST